MLQMRYRVCGLSIAGTVVILALAITGHSQTPRAGQDFHPAIPKTCDDAVLATLEVPLADPTGSPRHVPADYYYRIPVRPIYKSYPVYRPDREPAGYIDWLKQQEPQFAFDADKLKTPEDWIRAGEIVFNSPIVYGHIFRLSASDLYLPDADWYRSTGAPLLKDRSLPVYGYVIREKGKVEIGVNSCGMCHTRVMPDGSAIRGAQGNFPFDRAYARDLRNRPKLLGPLRSFMARRVQRLLYSAPWIHPQAAPALRNKLTRLAAFQNPEFYKAQGMRLPTYDKPRVVTCAEDHLDHIGLPRGCLDDLLQTLSDLNIKSELRDQRNTGQPLNATFTVNCAPSKPSPPRPCLPMTRECWQQLGVRKDSGRRVADRATSGQYTRIGASAAIATAMDRATFHLSWSAGTRHWTHRRWP